MHEFDLSSTLLSPFFSLAEDSLTSFIDTPLNRLPTGNFALSGILIPRWNLRPLFVSFVVVSFWSEKGVWKDSFLMPELIRLMFKTEEVVVSLFMLRLLNGRGFFFICSPETRPGFPGLIVVLFRFDAITREYLSGYNILSSLEKSFRSSQFRRKWLLPKNWQLPKRAYSSNRTE